MNNGSVIKVLCAVPVTFFLLQKEKCVSHHEKIVQSQKMSSVYLIFESVNFNSLCNFPQLVCVHYSLCLNPQMTLGYFFYFYKSKKLEMDCFPKEKGKVKLT